MKDWLGTGSLLAGEILPIVTPPLNNGIMYGYNAATGGQYAILAKAPDLTTPELFISTATLQTIMKDTKLFQEFVRSHSQEGYDRFRTDAEIKDGQFIGLRVMLSKGKK